MVQINIVYQGELHCEATHGPSSQILQTDAPVDNNGRGESFSPTDLVATALGTCMATVMGIVAQRKGVDLRNMTFQVGKHMSTDTPRRISRLDVGIFMPIPSNHPEATLLQAAALSCPVHHSLHPDITIHFDWHWSAPK